MKTNQKCLAVLGLISAAAIGLMTLPALAETGQPLQVEALSLDTSPVGVHFINDDGEEEDILSLKTGTSVTHPRTNTGDYTLKASYSIHELDCQFAENGSPIIDGTTGKVLLSLTDGDCVLSYPPITTVEMNFYTYGLSDNTESVFTVFQYDANGDYLEKDQEYPYSNNAWPIGSEAQQMEEDYAFANINVLIEGENIACHFADDANNKNIHLTQVHVAAVVSSKEGNSCILSDTAPEQPLPTTQLDVHMYTKGINMLTYLNIEEYHAGDTSPQQPISSYELTSEYFFNSEELSGHTAHTVLKVFAKEGNTEYTYTCAFEDGTFEISGIQTVYGYFDMSLEKPECNIYREALTQDLTVNFNFDDYWNLAAPGVRVKAFDVVSDVEHQAWALSAFVDDNPPQESITYEREPFTEYSYITIEDIEPSLKSIITCVFENDTSEIPAHLNEINVRGVFDSGSGTYSCTLTEGTK